MRFYDRIMKSLTGVPKSLRRTHGKLTRKSRPLGKRTCVALNGRALDYVQEIATRTQTTPDQVVKRSITLYKMALDSKEAKLESTVPT